MPRQTMGLKVAGKTHGEPMLRPCLSNWTTPMTTNPWQHIILKTMRRIGILSDTHSYWDDRYLIHFAECDEIWHAGDICSTEIIERLSAPFPTDGSTPPRRRIVRAVCGNCDGGDLRHMFPETLRWRCENVEVLMKHIGGYPGRYDRSVIGQLYSNPPQLFISGHSHILKVMYDKTLGTLHINPGAAGIQGWHKERTLIRLTIDGSKMRDMEIITLAERKPAEQ